MRQTRISTFMDFGWALATVLLVATSALSARAADDRMDAPSQALVSAAEPQGWSLGVHFVADSRELKQGGEVLELDANRLVAEVGYEVAPFLQLAGQLGSTKADLGVQDGENGLAWAVIARANLAEYILQESPEVGRKQWLGAALEVQYKANESNQSDGDLNWGETYVLPYIYYFQNRVGEALRPDYKATGYGLRAGLAFSSIDGELQSADIEENRNFGFMLGCDARWGKGWVARLRGTIYGSGDQAIEIGTLLYF